MEQYMYQEVSAGLKRRAFYKLCETVLTVPIIFFEFATSQISVTPTNFFISGIAVAYAALFFGLFFAIALSCPVNKRVDIFYSVIGFLLFFVTGFLSMGVVFLNEFNNGRFLTGLICLIEAVVILIDIIITYEDED